MALPKSPPGAITTANTRESEQRIGKAFDGFIEIKFLLIFLWSMFRPFALGFKLTTPPQAAGNITPELFGNSTPIGFSAPNLDFIKCPWHDLKT
ncbi:MAG: hypothetical protein V2I56_00315 [Desulfobacteraceae bacterium]|nr:hypothetical protein [Desulfobacteraceae bacterium]